MAVVEIARIQVRRGQENQTGVPLLEGGEFAWAADTEKLYIGLKIADGGSRNANVEILTENHLRNFFSTLSPLSTTASYVYQVGEDLTLNPDVSVNPFGVEFERTVQNRLDDNDVSISNFGVVGQGLSGDDTQIIQYAHDNLFLNILGKTYNRNTSQDNPVVTTARTLRFPPGIYRLQESVFLTKGAHIKGEGPDKTIIRVTSGGHSAFQTCSFQSKKGSYALQPGILAYVRYGDPEFGSGSNEPDNIIIEDLTIEYDSSVVLTEADPLIALHGSDNTIIRNVIFRGHYQITNTPSSNQYYGIELKGTETISCENVTIENCRFENIFYGIVSNFDIRNTRIYNNKFNDCNRGVVFNESIDLLAQFGPRSSRIVSNRFEMIKQEAIYAGPNSSNWATDHVSKNNQFIDVGNLNNAEGGGAGTSIIKYSTPGNRSVDDYFNRFEFHLQNAAAPLTYNMLVDGAVTLNLVDGGFKELDAGYTYLVCRIPINNKTQQLNIHFNISNNKTGNLFININSDGSSNFTEYYNFSAELDIFWSITPEPSGNSVKIEVLNNETTNYSLRYNISLLT